MITPVFNRMIILRGEPCIYEDPAGLGTAIYPGMLVQRIDPGNGKAVMIPHSRSGGDGASMIATEMPLNAGGTVDTVYAVGDIVRYHHAKSGDIVNLLLRAGQNVKIGAQLISNGDGTFIASASGDTVIATEHPVAVVDTAVNLTSTGAVNTLVPARIL